MWTSCNILQNISVELEPVLNSSPECVNPITTRNFLVLAMNFSKPRGFPEFTRFAVSAVCRKPTTYVESNQKCSVLPRLLIKLKHKRPSKLGIDNEQLSYTVAMHHRVTLVTLNTPPSPCSCFTTRSSTSRSTPSIINASVGSFGNGVPVPL